MLPVEVLVVEGIHALHGSILQHMDLKIFIDGDEATLRRLRHLENMRKRDMTAGDAATGISREWADDSLAVRPGTEVADLVVRVDTDFDYCIVEGSN